MINEVNVSCFLHAARNLSFQKTADDLFMSRQAVSQQIGKLEETLGVALFNRTPGKLALSTMGAAYFELFSSVETELERLRSTKGSRVLPATVSVRIGIMRTLERWNGFSVVADLCAARGCPISLIWNVMEPDELWTALTNDEVDVILSLRNQAFESSSCYNSFIADRIPQVLLISASHPLINSYPNEDDLSREVVTQLPIAKWCLPSERIRRKKPYYDNWRERNINITSEILFPNADSAILSIEQGACYCICPSVWRECKNPKFKPISLHHSLAYYCTYKANQLPQHRIFFEELENHRRNTLPRVGLTL